ncbi:hypothetical protein DV735_g1186, partial [Chaetothyriales sp. CBS 134920]
MRVANVAGFPHADERHELQDLEPRYHGQLVEPCFEAESLSKRHAEERRGFIILLGIKPLQSEISTSDTCNVHTMTQTYFIESNGPLHPRWVRQPAEPESDDEDPSWRHGGYERYSSEDDDMAKGSGVGTGLKEKLVPNKPLASAVPLGAADTLKVILTTQTGGTGKRPQQAFLLLTDPTTKLDISYPFSVKESGKGKIELTQADLPSQFVRSTSPINANIVIASLGASPGYNSPAFSLTVEHDPNSAIPLEDKPLRYSKLPEIHHIFRPDPKSPNIVIVLFFTFAAALTLPILLQAYSFLGVNIAHLSKATSDAPISHILFLGSVVSIETTLFLYFLSWRLFSVLPILGFLGIVAYISGSRALTEVQQRRLAGLR